MFLQEPDNNFHEIKCYSDGLDVRLMSWLYCVG